MKIVINGDLEEFEIGISSDILPHQEKAMIELGQWKKEATIRRLVTDDLHVPANFFPFDLPLGLSYERKIMGNTLKLGPVIAFLIHHRKTINIGERKYHRFMKHYPNVNGLVFLSSYKQIDVNKGLMKGFFYDPAVHRFEPIERTFPIPDAVYRRAISRNKKKLRLFRAMVKDQIFNVPMLNKYEQYHSFRDNKNVLSHFPEIKKLRTMKTIERMLQKHRSVYIKPINGLKANGIKKLRKEKGRYILQSGTETIEMTRKELTSYIHQLKKKKRYIVQQAVPSVEGQNIVMRAILQKNDQNQWHFSGGYARVGSDKCIVTNRYHTNEFLPIEEALQKYYRLTGKEGEKVVQSLVETCMDVCQGFDQKGVNYGDLAYDLIIDSSLKVWVIEVNNRAHNLRSPLLTIKDKDMYERVISMPLLYAKYLSGF